MKVTKNMWKCTSIWIMMLISFCISSFAVMAAENITMTSNGVVIPINVEDGDKQTRLYTYTIYDTNENNVGTLELRYGYETAIRLWIKTEDTKGESVEIADPHDHYFEIDRENKKSVLRIFKETWKSYFKDEEYTFTVSEKILPEITVPLSIKWDDNNPGRLLYNVDEAITDQYRIELFFNDFSLAVGISRGNGKIDFKHLINDNGNYTASIKAIGDKERGDSEYVYTEIPYVYTIPIAGRIGQTDKVWWTAKEGETIPTIVNWYPVAGVEQYEVGLDVYAPDGERMDTYCVGVIVRDKENSCDLSKYIADADRNIGVKLTYKASVRALSGNIEVVANSSEEDTVFADVYETLSDTVNGIKNNLKDATIDTISEKIGSIGIDSVALAMQINKEVQDQISALEIECVKQNGITVNPPVIDYPGIVSSNITAVGVGINAVSGGSAFASTIGLSFTKPNIENKIDVNEKLYENAVQVSITLKKDNQIVAGSLKCPITITMLPPKGVRGDQLVILHYHSDGTSEIIHPFTNADGTITFSVTSFSEFIFANLVQYNGGNDSGDDNKEPDDDNKEPDDDNSGNNSGNNSSNNGSSSNGGNHYYDDSSSSGSGSSSSRAKVNVGVQSYGNGKRFMKADGTYAKSEWVKKGDVWYYAGTDSILLTGWYQNVDGVWYFFKGDCEMATGWQMIDSKWYFLDPVNGDMKIGWLQDTDGRWYFLKADGDMKIGWLQTADGKWYYLGVDGACYMNTTTPDGYQVDENGAWIQ